MRTVAETAVFQRYAAEIWSDAERSAFINWIAANPMAGDIIPGSGGCRKVRWSRGGQELKMPADVEAFKRDLLESVRQMRRGKSARVTRVKVPQAAEARSRVGLSQQEFARLLGVSARTLQDWEQGRREPTGAARTLLRLAVTHPEVLLEPNGQRVEGAQSPLA